MSFAWGQSLPSNHYRTSEYRRSLYAETQTFEAPADRQIRNAVLDQVDDAIIPAIRKQVADGSTSAALKQLDGMDNKQIRKLFEDLLDSDNFDKIDKKWLRELVDGTFDASDGTKMATLAKSISGKTLQKELTASAVEEAAEGAAELIDKSADYTKRQKTLMKYSLAVVVPIGTLATFMGFGGNEALQKFIDNSTGRDCDIKALDKGLTEGTPEYEEAVGTCQEGSLKTLRNMGYAIIAVGGLLGFIAITRLIPNAEGE